ncbi:MAG: hypothetical protein PSX37_09510 [bacterium]|nr:hypothetical protein [bacterium]
MYRPRGGNVSRITSNPTETPKPRIQMNLEPITHLRTRRFSAAFFCTVTLLSVWCAGLALSGCSGPSKDADASAADAKAEEEAQLSPWMTGGRPKRETQASGKRGNSQADAEALAMARSVMGGAIVDDPATDNERLGMWSIVISVLRGDGAEQAARESQAMVQNAGGVRGTYVEKRGDTVVVAFGHYEDPTSESAQMDLVRIRSTVIEGTQPYLGAALSPPPFETIGTIPQYDLTTAKELPSNRKCIYTLQVAQYCRPDSTPPSMGERAEFRKAAEQAAVTLRREGEEAYYYHGPRMSVVTVGMFTDVEYRTQSKRSMENPESTVMLTRPVESLEIKQLRERRPYNLVNGQAMKTKTKGDNDAKIQRSIMVEIPR